jgi:hypothetical protein
VSQLFGSSVEKVSERNFENFKTFSRQILKLFPGKKRD